jgi:hypothetical protein
VNTNRHELSRHMYMHVSTQKSPASVNSAAPTHDCSPVISGPSSLLHLGIPVRRLCLAQKVASAGHAAGSYIASHDSIGVGFPPNDHDRAQGYHLSARVSGLPFTDIPGVVPVPLLRLGPHLDGFHIHALHNQSNNADRPRPTRITLSSPDSIDV